MEHKHLFWSKRGEVACEQHAPARQSDRWDAERWQRLPELEGRRITYQCQHCDKRAILHTRRKPLVEKPALILNVDDRPATLEPVEGEVLASTLRSVLQSSDVH
jgi:hypothetical protein